MKYEAPEVTALSSAIEAIQAGKAIFGGDGHDNSPAYEDWE